MALQPFDGPLHQFGAVRQIPLGVTDMSMAQVSGEHREPALDILPGAVPLDHRLDGETVAEVVQTRATVDFSLPQTSPSREFVEGPADGGGFQRAPEIGDEEESLLRVRMSESRCCV